MALAIVIAFAFTGAFGLIGPAVARRMPPSAGAWLLTIGGLLGAVSTLVALALLGLTVVGQTPEAAEYGHWSQTAFRQGDPIALPVGLAGIAVLLLLVAHGTVVALRRLDALRAAYGICAELPAHGGLVVVPDESLDAYALPGRPGRIVVTSGMLHALDAEERRALLEHERSHLRHAHHWHVAAAGVLAALNPLLWRLPAATGYTTERWADEDAARVVARPKAASALSRAVAAGAPLPRPRASMAAISLSVAARVSALNSSPVRARPLLFASAALTVVAAVVATAVAAEQTVELFTAATRAAGRGS
jgi:Zn-dependent protease with chaperone function